MVVTVASKLTRWLEATLRKMQKKGIAKVFVQNLRRRRGRKKEKPIGGKQNR